MLQVGSRNNQQSDPFESFMKYMMKKDLEIKLNKQEEEKRRDAERDERQRVEEQQCTDDKRRNQLMFQQHQLAQQQINAI